jgi:hypothetical protein
LSAKNVTVTVAAVEVARAGFINWIQGTGTTYTVAVNAQTDYITVTDNAAGGGGAVATDTIFDALGDLAVGTGADTAAVLTAGANDTILMAESGEATGLKWVASATPSTQAFGDAAAVGTSDTFTRGDHKHAMPADPVTAHAAAADPHTGYVLESLLDAKGDLITASADNTPAKLTVGADDTILMADAAAGGGLKWVASATPSTQAFGDAAATGTGDTFTRGDHKHAMPASPVTSIAKAGSSALTGAVTLTGGSNVTLTQSGQDVSIASAAGASLTSSTNYIAANVDMTTAGTYYDGPSLTVAAGTWLLIGQISIICVSTAVRTIQYKLWDGSATISSGIYTVHGTAATFTGSLPISGIVVPSGSTTYKISMTSSVNGDDIEDDAAVADTASYLVAVKIA